MHPLTLLLALTTATTPVLAEVKGAFKFKCGAKTYKLDVVKAAIEEGCYMANRNRKHGRYPHPYENRENFFSPGEYFEFPILKDGRVYKGGDPAYDRVIFDISCTHIGGVTHRNTPYGGDFDLCPGV